MVVLEFGDRNSRTCSLVPSYANDEKYESIGQKIVKLSSETTQSKIAVRKLRAAVYCLLLSISTIFSKTSYNLQIMGEADLDDNGYISPTEFELVVSKSPDFVK